jgi:hypothetical protein
LALKLGRKTADALSVAVLSVAERASKLDHRTGHRLSRLGGGRAPIVDLAERAKKPMVEYAQQA